MKYISLTGCLSRHEPERCAEEVEGADEDVEEDEEDGDADEAAQDVGHPALDGRGGRGGGHTLAQLPDNEMSFSTVLVRVQRTVFTYRLYILEMRKIGEGNV